MACNKLNALKKVLTTIVLLGVCLFFGNDLLQGNGLSHPLDLLALQGFEPICNLSSDLHKGSLLCVL